MDWRAVRFDWNRARAFLVSAEEGSFSAAARALGLTQPTVGRQVAALEEALGVVLFTRAGHALELTPTGMDLVEHARAMAEGATQLSLVAAGQSAQLEGRVCVAASQLISAYLLPPVVARLRVEHPGIELELVASNATQDLRRREADIAVRNFQPEQPGLIAKKVGDREACMYATPAYLARVGHPKTPADLSRAEFFGFDRTERMIGYLRPLGVHLTERNFPIVAENHLVQWQLCKQGAGICIVMDEVGDADPDVVQVVPEIRIPVPVWLVTHRELRTSRRMRVVFDVLAETLGRGAA